VDEELDENREEILISGSKRKPVTHIRAKASRLIRPLAKPGIPIK
jgi:hypothetical protein